MKQDVGVELHRIVPSEILEIDEGQRPSDGAGVVKPEIGGHRLRGRAIVSNACPCRTTSSRLPKPVPDAGEICSRKLLRAGSSFSARSETIRTESGVQFRRQTGKLPRPVAPGKKHACRRPQASAEKSMAWSMSEAPTSRTRIRPPNSTDALWSRSTAMTRGTIATPCAHPAQRSGLDAEPVARIVFSRGGYCFNANFASSVSTR